MTFAQQCYARYAVAVLLLCVTRKRSLHGSWKPGGGPASVCVVTLEQQNSAASGFSPEAGQGEAEAGAVPRRARLMASIMYQCAALRSTRSSREYISHSETERTTTPLDVENRCRSAGGPGGPGGPGASDAPLYGGGGERARSVGELPKAEAERNLGGGGGGEVHGGRANDMATGE